jgi:NAD(P)-dependent dehydrogenase (short-subunit alcohol dehydrogenase family)
MGRNIASFSQERKSMNLCKEGTIRRFDLSGRKAIVTGGSRGIGKSIALGLAEAGAEICVVSRVQVEAAQSLASQLREMGRLQSFAIQADVSNRESIESVVHQVIERWGKIDVLVNNAGISIGGPAESFSESDWDRVMDVNVKGVFLCAQAVGRQMMQQKGGNIINVGSISGLVAPRPQACYNASKAAVHMLTKCLAAEWAPFGIRVNCIAPGFILTDMTSPSVAKYPERTTEYMVKPAVLNRIGQPDELAGAAVFLASDASTFMTGEIMVIDGGYTIR